MTDRSTQTTGDAASRLTESLARLKHTLTTATDLNDPWRLFEAEYVANQGMTTGAQIARDPALEHAITHGAGKILGASGPLTRPRFMHHAKHNFWNGTGRIGEWNVICYFFTDIGMGLAGYFKDSGGRVELTRMTMVVAPAEASPGKQSFVRWSRKVGRARA